MNIIDPAIEEYATVHSSPAGKVLDHVDAETREHLDAPGMMVGPVEGRFLEMLVYTAKARRVLEVGCFSGYSSIAMAAGLAAGGKIVTCELNPRHVEFARRHIDYAGLSEVIEVVEGPALDTIRGLEGPFDLVFIDANKSGYVDYYEASLPLLAEGGLIVADNTFRDGRVLEDDVDDETAGMIRFNEHVLADDRVTCVMLSVRDGMTLIRKNG